MKGNFVELLFIGILFFSFIFVVIYYFCVVNNLDKKNRVCSFVCRRSNREVVVFAQLSSMVLGCLGCKIIRSRYELSYAEFSMSEWDVLLFTVFYGFSFFFILFCGKSLVKKFGIL